MTGHVAFVSGASRGIGKAVSQRLARDGFAIALNASRESDELTSAVDMISEAGGRAAAFPADISDATAAAAALKCAETVLGPLDVIVINAGINLSQPLFLTSPDAWRKVLATNLDSAFWQAKIAARSMMRRRAGRIVFVASDAALSGDALHAAYSASKAGIIGLMRSTARELAPFGITVNAVAPGPVDTDMTASLTEQLRMKQISMIPLHRFGKPEEIASVVAFLVSDSASYITGQVVSVDGGLRTQV